MFLNLLRRTPSKNESVADPLPPVVKAMGYTWTDLSANRDGRISYGQIKRLRAQMRHYTLWILIALFMMPIFSAPFIERLVTILLGLREPLSLSMVLYFFIALTPVIPLIWAMRRQAEIREDLIAGVVQMLEGRVVLSHQERGSRRTHCVVTLDTYQFDVSAKIYDCFVDRADYRLYVAPGTAHLLGAEEIRRGVSS